MAVLSSPKSRLNSGRYYLRKIISAPDQLIAPLLDDRYSVNAGILTNNHAEGTPAEIGESGTDESKPAALKPKAAAPYALVCPARPELVHQHRSSKMFS
jgi:hypothetical protein